MVFVTGATGNLPPKTGTNLTFNSNTGDLTATSATLDHTTVGSAVTISESGVNAVGVITATSFVGDGSSLTGTGNTSNVRTGILDVAGIATFRANTLVGSGITLSTDGNAFYTGVVTATSFVGDGSSLTGTGNTANVRTGILDVAGISTFRDDIIVGAGITISPDGDIFATGVTTFSKQIVGIQTNNVIPFYYGNISEFPSSSTYHGAFAHAHNTGRAYFAHAGWKELVNKEINGTVGTGTERYNVGILTATTIRVGSGVTLSSDGDAFVTGVSTATKFVGNLSDAVIGRWTVTNNGSSAYRFTGPGGLDGSEDNSTIYVARGQTYEFNVNASGHPFQIRSSAGGSAYNTGVTNNGAQSGVVKFEVPFAAPAQLVYQCTNHSGMVGILSVFPAT